MAHQFVLWEDKGILDRGQLMVMPVGPWTHLQVVYSIPEPSKIYSQKLWQILFSKRELQCYFLSQCCSQMWSCNCPNKRWVCFSTALNLGGPVTTLINRIGEEVMPYQFYVCLLTGWALPASWKAAALSEEQLPWDHHTGRSPSQHKVSCGKTQAQDWFD